MIVSHGSEQQEVAFPLGVTVEDVRDTLQHVVNIPGVAIVKVNGERVGLGYVPGPDSTVEFITEVGHKGVGRVWTPEEYCQFFNLTERDLQQHIERGLRVMQVADGTMRITETAVDEFIRGAGGGVGGEVVVLIANSLNRIANHFDPPPPDIVDTEYIAKKLDVTKVYVAQMALDGRIPRNCIVPGTGNGKVWKFYRSRVDPWILIR